MESDRRHDEIGRHPNGIIGFEAVDHGFAMVGEIDIALLRLEGRVKAFESVEELLSELRK